MILKTLKWLRCLLLHRQNHKVLRLGKFEGDSITRSYWVCRTCGRRWKEKL